MQREGLGIWDLSTNAGGEARDYDELVPWWHYRDNVVQDYRAQGPPAGIESVRLDYEAVVEAAIGEGEIAVFCDLQGGINKWTDGGVVIYAGSKQHKFNLWTPEIEQAIGQQFLQLIATRYAGHGRGYVYVKGEATRYPDTEDGIPESVLTDLNQLTDSPPAT